MISAIVSRNVWCSQSLWRDNVETAMAYLEQFPQAGSFLSHPFLFFLQFAHAIIARVLCSAESSSEWAISYFAWMIRDVIEGHEAHYRGESDNMRRGRCTERGTKRRLSDHVFIHLMDFIGMTASAAAVTGYKSSQYIAIEVVRVNGFLITMSNPSLKLSDTLSGEHHASLVSTGYPSYGKDQELKREFWAGIHWGCREVVGGCRHPSADLLDWVEAILQNKSTLHKTKVICNEEFTWTVDETFRGCKRALSWFKYFYINNNV